MASIQHSILQWFDANKRDLPWRQTKNPYSVWISEIILQQTRVEQGRPFYERFMNRFPSVFDLAKASEEEVLLAWKGLGYYTRARNLHKAAKTIVADYGGSFPSQRSLLLKLPGIGEYTASAIASICWEQPFIAVDGNIIRILSRVFNLAVPYSQAVGRDTLNALGQEILSKERPGDFNQALMDLGSSICLPKSPRCDECPLIGYCEAKKNNLHLQRPVKTPKKSPIDRYFIFFLVEKDGALALVKQTKLGVWRNLYLFPSMEFSSASAFMLAKPVENYFLSGTHILSHQRIHYIAIEGADFSERELQKEEWSWMDVQAMDHVPVPKLMANIFEAWVNVKTKD